MINLREITIGNFKELTLAKANLEAVKIKLDMNEGIARLQSENETTTTILS